MDLILEKLQRLEDENADMKGELAACKAEVRSGREKIARLERKLIDNQSKLEEMDSAQRDPAGCASQCRCVSDVKRELSVFEKRFEKLDKLSKDLESEHGRTKKLQHILSSVALTKQKKLQDNMYKAEEAEGPKEALESPQSHFQAIDQRIDHSGSSRDVAFSVKLHHSQPLQIGRDTQLDTVKDVIVPNRNFDVHRCLLHVASAGVYVLYVKARQRGAGMMEVRIFKRSPVALEPTPRYVGTTKGDWDTVGRMFVVKLGAGDRCTVVVKAMSGSPRVHWCEFNGFLVSQ